MSVRRRSTPPVEKAPKTWVQVVFFPVSLMSLASMAAMLLIYLSPATPLAVPIEFPSPGGIVIEK
jgi:hypothetical protein